MLQMPRRTSSLFGQDGAALVKTARCSTLLIPGTVVHSVHIVVHDIAVLERLLHATCVQNKLAGAYDEQAAIAEFSSKFRSKTGNAWDKRDAFAHKSGKYDLVDIDEDTDDQSAALAGAPKKPKIEGNATYLPSTLDPATQQLISLIFNEDMFNEAMSRFDIDVSKMPLGMHPALPVTQYRCRLVYCCPAPFMHGTRGLLNLKLSLHCRQSLQDASSERL